MVSPSILASEMTSSNILSSCLPASHYPKSLWYIGEWPTQVRPSKYLDETNACALALSTRIQRYLDSDQTFISSTSWWSLILLFYFEQFCTRSSHPASYTWAAESNSDAEHKKYSKYVHDICTIRWTHQSIGQMCSRYRIEMNIIICSRGRSVRNNQCSNSCTLNNLRTQLASHQMLLQRHMWPFMSMPLSL